MANIEVIQYEQAEGELKQIYDDLIESRGKLADVHMIQSLNPRSIVNHMDLYMTVMFGKSPLSRARREMMAVVVSRENNCEYCQLHHAEAVNHYWKDDLKVKQLREDYRLLSLPNVDKLLCDYASQLTRDPSADALEIIGNLKKAGLEDRAVLDATLVISYFNFVNRIVLSMGLAPDAKELKGYRYD